MSLKKYDDYGRNRCVGNLNLDLLKYKTYQIVSVLNFEIALK